MESAIRNRLKKILILAYKEDWSDKSFSLKKAYVCAELSAIVYLDVQEYELKKASRIHLFASKSFQKIIESKEPVSRLIGLDEANLEGQFFLSRSRYAIILGAYFGDVVILSVRGTVFRQLWDWKANVDARKFNVSSCAVFPFEYKCTQFDDQFFHRGFFESIVPQFASIADEIEKLRKQKKQDPPTIVWAGHSLGGAMAAIGNAVSQSHYFQPERIPGNVVGAYTFGMPRYCGLGAICHFATPFHIYKKQDLVPTVPLRKMGFADSSREYELTEDGKLRLAERNDVFGVMGHVPKLKASLNSHSIEGYAESLAKVVGISRP